MTFREQPRGGLPGRPGPIPTPRHRPRRRLGALVAALFVSTTMGGEARAQRFDFGHLSGARSGPGFEGGPRIFVPPSRLPEGPTPDRIPGGFYRPWPRGPGFPPSGEGSYPRVEQPQPGDLGGVEPVSTGRSHRHRPKPPKPPPRQAAVGRVRPHAVAIAPVRPVVALTRPRRPRPVAPIVAVIPSIVPDEVLFELRPNAPAGAAEALARRYRLAPLRSDRFDILGTVVFRDRLAPHQPVAAALRALLADPRVASAQANSKFRLQGGAGVATSSGTQWTADKLHLPAIHDVTRGDSILVAAIDSGIDATHSEFSGSGFKLINVLDTAFAAHEHGTAIAGALAAHDQLTGVAPGARILGLRAFDSHAPNIGAEGTTDHILRALDWADKEKANVVNLSFAGPQDALLSRMLAALERKGVAIVAAAGNAGPKSPPLYPAADPNVIAVTATDSEDGLYAAANHGSYICVAAPGVDVLEPAPGGAYQITSGTSIAAAHVSGLVALLLARDPTLRPDAIRRILTETAGKLGPSGSDAFGSGLVDALRAVHTLDPKPTVGTAPPVGAATIGDKP